MSVPDPRRDDACRYARSIAHRHSTVASLVAAVNEARGLAWTRKALQCAYRRFREVEPGPKLGDILGKQAPMLTDYIAEDGRRLVSDFIDEDTWPGAVAPALHEQVTVAVHVDPGTFDWTGKRMAESIRASVEAAQARGPVESDAIPLYPDAIEIIREAKARVSIDTDLAAGPVEPAKYDIHPESAHPFKLPKETTAKKLPRPSERIVPWDWSEAPPRRMILESDNHYSHEDKRFQAVKFEFAARRGCDALFNLGDQHDFTNLSRFDKDPAYANTVWDDIKASNERHWRPATQIFKHIEFLEGNHDWRIYKAVMANHAFFGLPSLMDWHTLGVPDEVTCHTYGTHRQIGHVWGEHGDQMRGQNPTHYGMLHRGGRVTAFGHTHKPGCYIRVLRAENGSMIRREVYNLGHGQDESTCDLWAGTVKGWSHSFLYVEHYERADGGWDVNVYPIHTDRGVFSFDGVVYRG